MGIETVVQTGEEKQDLGTITLGRNVCFRNFTEEGGEETIIIRCFLNGLGGDVHVVPGNLEEIAGSLDFEQVFNEEHHAGDIGPMQPFSKEVFAPEGRIGELVLSHVGFTLN